ncbi:unnamed protein product [Urochloa humidicola]
MYLFVHAQPQRHQQKAELPRSIAAGGGRPSRCSGRSSLPPARSCLPEKGGAGHPACLGRSSLPLARPCLPERGGIDRPCMPHLASSPLSEPRPPAAGEEGRRRGNSDSRPWSGRRTSWGREEVTGKIDSTSAELDFAGPDEHGFLRWPPLLYRAAPPRTSRRPPGELRALLAAPAPSRRPASAPPCTSRRPAGRAPRSIGRPCSATIVRGRDQPMVG